MSFRFAQANVEAPDSARDSEATMKAVLDWADVVTLNEMIEASSRVSLDKFTTFDHYHPAGTAGNLAIAWRKTKFKSAGPAGALLVMLGGHVGADGTTKGPDNRRVGPSRYVIWKPLVEVATGRLVVIATHHAVAKADTTAKWRQDIRADGWAGVGTALAAVKRQYPGASFVIAGDMNARGRVDFPGFPETEVGSPSTYGSSRYDRMFVAYGARATGVITKVTKSDHKALLGIISLPGDTTPPVPGGRPIVVKPIPKPTPNASNSTGKDWFSMATQADLEKAVAAALADPKVIDKIATAVWRHPLPGMTDAPDGRFAQSVLSNLHNDMLAQHHKE